MRDNLLKFGAIAAAVKTTEVFSADIIDFGTIDTKSPFSDHRTGQQHELSVVFNIAADLAAGDYINNFKLQHCATEGGSYVDLIVGPACAAAAKKGNICVLPMPKKHLRFVKAGCTPQSSGTFTAISVEAWLEPGPNL